MRMAIRNPASTSPITASGPTRTPSRTTSRVGEPRMPIFFSDLPSENPSASLWRRNAVMLRPFAPVGSLTAK